MKNITILLLLLAFAATESRAQDAPQYIVPLTLTSGMFTNTLYIGIHPDCTIGLDESPDLGEFREEQLPPPPPPPYDFDVRLTTIPFRPSNYPDGLGTGVAGDYRGYTSPVQVDTFRVFLTGTAIENDGATISWPANLATYASSWIIKGIAGTTLPETSMTGTTSVTLQPIFAGLQALIISTGIAVSVEQTAPVAESSALSQNYPNPFNPATRIPYAIATTEHVTLQVFDALGSHVRTLVDEVQTPGEFQAMFTATGLRSGVYFYRLSAGSFIAVRTMVMLK